MFWDLRLCKYPISYHTFPHYFLLHWWILSGAVIAILIFCFHCSWNSGRKNLFFPIYFFYSHIYLYKYRLMSVCFILLGKILCCHLFCCTDCLSIHHWGLSHWLYIWHAHIIILTSPCNLLSCTFPCPSPGISNVSKEPWFFLLENSLENSSAGLLTASLLGCLCLLGLLTGQSKEM